MDQHEKEQSYLDAFQKLKNASTAEDYRTIIRLLEQCDGIMDSEDLIVQCKKELANLQLEETYQLAVSLSKKRDSASMDKSLDLLSSLGDYKDSGFLLEKIRRKKEHSPFHESASEHSQCPKCGEINPLENEFCAYCGATLSSHSKSPSQKTKIPVLVGAIAAILLVAAAGIFLHSHSGKKPDSSMVPDVPAEYTEYIGELQNSSSGIEDGKLIVCPSEETNWDGTRKRLLYDRYGIADIDGDGRQELILTYIDWAENNGLAFFKILRLNTDTATIDTVSGLDLSTLPDYGSMFFFRNGIIALSHSGTEFPSYLFTNEAIAESFDFSGSHSLSHGGLLSFEKTSNPNDGNTTIICFIGNFASVSASREYSVEEAGVLLSDLESSEPVPVTMHSFVGAPDVVCQY